ncbi:DHA2 family efflux MFS transporter permease subunit [Desmospora activa]|nr:DHA2 family efflux MFS transporter permease subunit [Desmospora activa]
MISLIVGAFFAILNETLLNVAYTDLIEELEVTAATIQWLATGFMLVVGVLVPVTALLNQWFTTRQMFFGAMILFTIGTFVCGISPNFSILLIGRLIQAGGTGLLLPVMMNTILVLYPPHERGGAMGTIGLVIMFAPAIGPTLSGLIVETLHWRWLFFLVLPFALLSIVVSSIYLKNVWEVTKPKVDIISILLSTLGFGGVVFGFSSAGEGNGGWMSPEVYIPLGVGGISLLLFLWRQLKVKEPLLDVRAFQYPMFSLATVQLMIMMMTLFSTIIILPMFLQGAATLSAFITGLILLPGGILNGFISPVVGRLFDKYGPRMLVIPGTIIVMVVMWFIAGITPTTSIPALILLHSLLMIGIAMVMMPVQTNGLNQLPRRYYPHGTAILNTLQQVAGAIGVALFISIMTAGQSKYMASVSDPTAPIRQVEALTAGVQGAFSIGMIFAVVGFVLALFIKRSAAHPEA